MITPEQYISDLEKQISKLEVELEQAQKDIRDFEVLAQEWRKGHQDLKFKSEVKLREKDQIIAELEDEIEELKADFKDLVFE